MTPMPEPSVSPADMIRRESESLRTTEQWEWIRKRYKPDGLRRIARANRDYADSHGEYLPDVAALAYAEWERAEALLDVGERDKAEIEALHGFLAAAQTVALRDRRQIAQLTEALREQWEWNHSEHCCFDGPHEGNCFWPLPVILGGDPAVYRTYSEHAVLAGEEDAE